MRYSNLSPLLVLTGLLSVHPFAFAQDKKLEDILAYARISENLATSGQMKYDQIETIKKAGFEVIVNLATANKVGNAMEGFLVTDQGMTYVQIPIDFDKPALRDLDMFMDVMDANKDRKVHVHCGSSKRASTFTYLYRTLRLEVPEDAARKALEAVWDPSTEKQWAGLIEQARARAATKAR